ncbi:MAG: group II intron reverse transcriptase/maturase [Moorea sp. SIOASIH]|uniref:group II intron reverse transcriptase/maturase n=1 Tax=Moorena sp. SIOASIH TaxID=2607817 RepID=UPI0013B669BA|nr:group II intron reverse transcriptase/maturase [Moorena sp. SIOASIH]NEO35697.1 group II intron reverse transcriptase/maturase [Moorena sp. SIOASIH]NEO37889.1 group II intron reverse transcriptase/maturase [Moorena sp. SIOASIH]NEO39675.1 group II intron reverse transcriptase/maturase [Moorena sp. SIOASIH]
MEKIEPNPTGNGIVTKQTTDWHATNWKRAYRTVRKLRRRIFKATREGNWKKVNKLQRLMLRSYSNIQVSVRQATQVNSGKKTAGIDGETKLNPAERGKMVDSLTTYKTWKPIPTKRIYIPKSNGKKRPLGIPSITDRCLQGIVKNALEPSWEARFEPVSYGFRPGRSTHDARQRIFQNINGEKNRKWWVLDADISGCFDNIAHQPLLETIGNFPAANLIEEWLKAGYVHKGVFHNTEEGTPQGGIISPLLANIALHGLEEELGIRYKWIPDKRKKDGGWWCNTSTRTYVRFADDFVILTESEEDAAEAKKIVERWLSNKGLTLSEEKTKISHLTEGFDFLGWNFRKCQTTNRKTGLITLIKPSQKSVKKVKENLRIEFKRGRTLSQKVIIGKINSIVRGWSNYHNGAVSKEIFSNLDHYVFWKLQRWGRRKHAKKSQEWVNKKYFGNHCPGREDKWVFGDGEIYLDKFAWTPIQRHTMVAYDKSPDNPELVEYWNERELKQSAKTAKKRLSTGKDKIANRQEYQCPVCKQSLGEYQNTHLHHIIPQSLGGHDRYDNLIYLHEDCHYSIHALGATNPEIQQMLRNGIKTPSKKRNKSQKVQNRKSRKSKLHK